MDKVKLFTFILVGLTCCNCEKFATSKPDFINTCRLESPENELNKCLLDGMQKLFDQIGRRGVPDINVSPVDPYNLEKVQYTAGGNSAANLKAEFNDVIVKGWNNVIVNDATLSKSNDDFVMKIKLKLPLMNIKGKYAFDGNILLVPLKGAGPMELNLENLEINLQMKTKLIEKSGEKLLNFINIKSNIRTARMKSRWENLFNGNKELEESTNALFNESWEDLFDVLRPTIKKSMEDVILNTFKQVYGYIPAKYQIEDLQ